MRFNIKLKICNKCYIVYLSVIYNVVLYDVIEIKLCERDVYRLGWVLIRWSMVRVIFLWRFYFFIVIVMISFFRNSIDVF